MRNESNRDEFRPLITFFLSPYPAHLYEEDLDEVDSHDIVTLEDLQAALYKKPPTACTTPGKTRPAGYSRTGKYLPSKYIPSKIDKRAGK